MQPTYLDLHIHTSIDPENLNQNYDIELLDSQIKDLTNGSTYLISLTDHNTINSDAYLKSIDIIENVIIGSELHIQNYPESPAYHCHIYFDIEITADVLNDLNEKLDNLYPNKRPRNDDPEIPTIEQITKEFDNYEFLLLPHGGQSHSTFNQSIPSGVKFDTTLQRTIYYNQFDGFTARSNQKLEATQNYFKKLGINEFVNLVTCSDNYDPQNYPNPSAGRRAQPFIPTWMLARPTFNGLRLSLSESSRLIYSNQKPQHWSEHIGFVKLNNDEIDIEVELTSGLNVIIGDSSSGKTLFADSLFRKANNDFELSDYEHFGISGIEITNPAAVVPHYLPQNYITDVVSKYTDNSLESIEIIGKVFPGDSNVRERVDYGLAVLKSDLQMLIDCVKRVEEGRSNLLRCFQLDRLINKGKVRDNIVDLLMPDPRVVELIRYSRAKHNQHNEVLSEIDTFLSNNPLMESKTNLINELKENLTLAQALSEFESSVRGVLTKSKTEFDEWLKLTNQEEQAKRQGFLLLLSYLTEYAKAYRDFQIVAKRIASYSFHYESQKIESMGHELLIENNFKLTKQTFIDVINKYLKAPVTNGDFDLLRPDDLFKDNHKQRPKVLSYEDLENRINSDFQKLNKKRYKIIAADGRNFEDLSAGWKTSIILDIILGYKGDMAPIIIDQPEDNLANKYINDGLVEVIKKIKHFKQIILVSHNATIPMLGDAQNVVLCRNIDGKINIRSNRLEGAIDGVNILDYIADITDGGKASVKKRVKKYNLKNFKESE